MLAFDLGIAVAILAAVQTLPAGGLDDLVFIGELGLGARIRPVPGVLPAAAAAAAAGFEAVAVAGENAAEAALVPDLRVHVKRLTRTADALLAGHPA